MKREVMILLADEVGTPEDTDNLFRYFLASQGAPCALVDNVGLRIVCNIEDHYTAERSHIPKYPVDCFRRKYVDKGNLGMMTGAGLGDPEKLSETLLSG